MTGLPHPPTIFVDADNTVWDTDAVFADAQLALLTAVESAVGKSSPQSDRLAFLRAIDQSLAEIHHAGLRYPPSLLVRATELALRGIKGDRAARTAWRDGAGKYLLDDAAAASIEQNFFSDLAKPPRIRLGVWEGLHELKLLSCPMIIVTEGDKARAVRNANQLELTRFFDRVIEGQKSPELYRRILSLIGNPARAFMVGDQLDRDIAPAKAAGLETIYFPGGFLPRWTPDESSVQPDHIISSFAEVPAIVSRAAGDMTRA